jgi:hypothetical protein
MLWSSKESAIIRSVKLLQENWFCTFCGELRGNSILPCMMILCAGMQVQASFKKRELIGGAIRFFLHSSGSIQIVLGSSFHTWCRTLP